MKLPMFSLFTPTHDRSYLFELWDTIKDQKAHFEWVIVYNGAHAKRDYRYMKEKIQDDRVRHIMFPKNMRNGDGPESRIGVFKKFACSQCIGEILVEVDHDDLLSPDCLEELEKAFEDPEIGFAYSDFAEFFDKSWDTQVYGANSGWETYPVEFRDKKLIAHKAFKPDPRSICQIEFAPNHVRAWRRSVYEEIGGHAALAAGDDHELLCRTYLATKMKHIEKCLYFYRRLESGNNSYLQRYKLIREQDIKNRNDFLWKMIERWCDLEGLEKVDLGAAHGKPEGYLGIDIIDGIEGVLCHDVTKGLPFEDNSIGVIRAVDFLEHIPDKINIVNEIYRVLAPGGWFISITPSTDGRGAFQDPTHISFYNENSFLYYTRKSLQQYVPALKCRFQAVRLFTTFPTDYHKNMNICYVYSDLVAIKEGYRPPGILEI